METSTPSNWKASLWFLQTKKQLFSFILTEINSYASFSKAYFFLRRITFASSWCCDSELLYKWYLSFITWRFWMYSSISFRRLKSCSLCLWDFTTFWSLAEQSLHGIIVDIRLSIFDLNTSQKKKSFSPPHLTHTESWVSAKFASLFPKLGAWFYVFSIFILANLCAIIRSPDS